MTGTLIATTNKADVHGLAYKGIMAWSRFPQLRDMLARKFGDEYVLFFARPVENTQTSEIDWYTPVQGEAKSVDELPEAEKEAACEKVRAMANDVAAYADELAASPDPLKATRGHILKLALLYPDDSYIYVAGKQPVIVCWGFGPGTPGVEPKNLMRLAPPKAAPVTEAPVEKAPAEEAASPVPPAAERKPLAWGWLWWLLPLLALLLLFWLLFTSFGGLPAIGGQALFQGPRLPFTAEYPDRAAELAELEKEVDDLYSQAEKHAALCRPERQPVVEPQQPVTQAPQQPAGGAAEDLVIPEQAQDTSFLAGEWLCRTGLANARTREPVEFAFQFGPDGRGTATVFEKSDRCSGPAVSSLENGELRINVGPQVCAKSGSSYSPLSIICSGASGQTRCRGNHEGGGSWDANFEKVR